MEVIGIGVPVWDQIILLEKLPQTNQSARALDMSWQYGGKVPTALVALARLGRQAAMVGTVGGAFGADCRTDFERHGVDCSHLIDREGTLTAACLALAEKSTGGRSFIGMPGGLPFPALLAPQELDREFIASCQYLLLSDMDEGSLQAARWVHAAGGQVVMDADAYTARIDENLQEIDHLIASEFFYAHLFGGCTDYEENLRALRGRMRADGVAVVTLGERGLAGLDRAGEFFVQPAFSVEVVDTTGAGDVFHGGYIAGLLRGMTVQEACRYAAAGSAIKCTRLGGRAGIPDHETLAHFMKTGEIDYGGIDPRVAYYKQSPMTKRG